MATDYISLLNLTYEIEGLVMLHINRGDEASPEMTKLLDDKIRRLASYLPDQAPEPRVAPLQPETVAPAPAPSVTDAQPAPVIAPTPDQEAIAETVMEEETEDAYQDTPTPDQKAIAEAAIEEEVGDAGKDPSQDKEEPLRLEEKLARDRARDIFKAFTINDKFRFRRELFRNSQEEFDETLYVIAQMSDFDEAEEYFYNDLCWNPDNEDVKEFMGIVKKHF